MPRADIVVVEDDGEDARVVVSVLQKHCPRRGISIARDGAEALDILLSEDVLSAPPRMILLDLKLPKVSGLEVLQRIRLEPRLEAVPVIVLTSSREAPDLKNAYAMGANSYLCKPVEFREFVQVVTQTGLYWMVVNEVPI